MSDLISYFRKNYNSEFAYFGGGYFRKRGFPKGENAPILHGEEMEKFILQSVEKVLKNYLDNTEKKV